MSDTGIKKVTLNDIKALEEISRQTFYDTFSAFNTEENMQNYMLQNFSIEKLINELQDQFAEFYFAMIDDIVAGYIKMNYAVSQTELKQNNSLEIERIYVLKKCQGKKLGLLLLNNAIEIAKQKNLKYIWLGVWEKNFNAISFYKKYGFVEFDSHIFKLGDDFQTDIMMKLNLQDNT